MKANELRIGNWVNIPNTEIAVDIKREDFQYTKGLSNLEDYEPIPLTEEWLVDFGFVSLSNILEFGRGKYFVRKRYDKNFEMRQGLEYNSFTKPFKYVHQLQNLYFALTGKELELKIKD